jgi:predicted glycogen debranching enzyme
VVDGVPRWRWSIGGIVVRRELAMQHGRPAVGIVHRLVRAPGAVRLELTALCTWRDAHGDSHAGPPPVVAATVDGFTFEDAYRVAGPGFEPIGQWYRGCHYREERARGLTAEEDLWCAGRFTADVEPGEAVEVVAWADHLDDPPAPASVIVASARARSAEVVSRSRPHDDVDRALALAADQFVVDGPGVVAGYPWFGRWSRDTMTAYEGLFLETGRAEEGRRLLRTAAAALSGGMLENTGAEFNTADATLWFIHAVGRHVTRTGDSGLAADLWPSLRTVIDHHVAGTRYGIQVDADGLLRAGAPGLALTWMDARIEGVPVTRRAGKPVEIEALWINALGTMGDLASAIGEEAAAIAKLAERATAAFRSRFEHQGAVLDTVDPDDVALRPNQLLAASLPHGPWRAAPAVQRCAAALLTPLGLRSLAPGDAAYRSTHRGGPAERDGAYHQGTVWPWLLGPFVEASMRTQVDVAGVLDGVEAHLSDAGIGSVSETADGDPPHGPTGCPFQAWSVAEVLRARRLLQRDGE